MRSALIHATAIYVIRIVTCDREKERRREGDREGEREKEPCICKDSGDVTRFIYKTADDVARARIRTLSLLVRLARRKEVAAGRRRVPVSSRRRTRPHGKHVRILMNPLTVADRCNSPVARANAGGTPAYKYIEDKFVVEPLIQNVSSYPCYVGRGAPESRRFWSPGLSRFVSACRSRPPRARNVTVATARVTGPIDGSPTNPRVACRSCNRVSHDRVAIGESRVILSIPASRDVRQLRRSDYESIVSRRRDFADAGKASCFLRRVAFVGGENAIG